MRYLFQPGEHEDEQRRATEPIWLLKVYKIKNVIYQNDQPALYYLADGAQRTFSGEEQMVIPPDTELPLNRILIRKKALQSS